ncbi:hypothetical protein [Paraburkholderia terrae]|uniref:hypothetical protein n=1 Tax=Paraburkholderia terrae TaxID=311230 RepID=UPI0033655503
MPTDSEYQATSYFELRTPANHLLTLRVGCRVGTSTILRFALHRRRAENYKVMVMSTIPKTVKVFHIENRDGHYAEEPLDDLEIVRRCSRPCQYWIDQNIQKLLDGPNRGSAPSVTYCFSPASSAPLTRRVQPDAG